MTSVATKHTPGPWTTDRLSDDDGGRCVGTTKGAVCLMTTDRYPASETTANAHLIAAAPDLLAACDDALTFLAQYIAAGPKLEGVAGLPGPYVLQTTLRAAITRAKGGAQ